MDDTICFCLLNEPPDLDSSVRKPNSDIDIFQQTVIVEPYGDFDFLEPSHSTVKQRLAGVIL